MSIGELLTEELKQVDAAINACILDKEEYIHAISDYLIFAGGKRLRPTLAILAAKLFDYKGDKHIQIAAAVECIHSATLLHDDVVDESELRRGNLASHLKWGNKCSILVGDFLFSQAFGMMVKTESLAVLEILAKAAGVIAEGEVMQLSALKKLDTSKNKYIKIISAKTAELFAAATKAGAHIAGQSEQTCQTMYDFGLNTGIAFQIIDDLLDYTGEEAKIGKKIGDDFFEGKVTLPVLLAYELADESEKNYMQQIFKQETRNAEDFNKLIIVMNKYQALASTSKLAANYIEKAKNCLKLITPNKIRDTLESIINEQEIRVK